MQTNFVLIDYENVQPKDLAMLRDGPFKVKIFLGAHQSRIPVTLAAEIQHLGENAEYVLLESSGSNALDFHIAYFIGVLSTQDPAAAFHIISRDAGFDPLIKHLKTKGVIADRVPTIANMSFFTPAGSSILETRVTLVIVHLTKLKAAKPRTEKTLRSTLHALFRKELTEHELSALFSSLCGCGVVKVEGTKVAYQLSFET